MLHMHTVNKITEFANRHWWPVAVVWLRLTFKKLFDSAFCIQAHNALHCQVGLGTGNVVLVVLTLAEQTNSAKTLDLFLPTSEGRPMRTFYGAMVERRDGPMTTTTATTKSHYCFWLNAYRQSVVQYFCSQWDVRLCSLDSPQRESDWLCAGTGRQRRADYSLL